ncbi:MAG: hypothetical protein WAM14_25945 [Candidatus Nitrosopolaris sp.]
MTEVVILGFNRSSSRLKQNTVNTHIKVGNTRTSSEILVYRLEAFDTFMSHILLNYRYLSVIHTGGWVQYMVEEDLRMPLVDIVVTL